MSPRLFLLTIGKYSKLFRDYLLSSPCVLHLLSGPGTKQWTKRLSLCPPELTDKTVLKRSHKSRGSAEHLGSISEGMLKVAYGDQITFRLRVKGHDFFTSGTSDRIWPSLLPSCWPLALCVPWSVGRISQTWSGPWCLHWACTEHGIGWVLLGNMSRTHTVPTLSHLPSVHHWTTANWEYPLGSRSLQLFFSTCPHLLSAFIFLFCLIIPTTSERSGKQIFKGTKAIFVSTQLPQVFLRGHPQTLRTLAPTNRNRTVWK
jgi:hypothetical protein